MPKCVQKIIKWCHELKEVDLTCDKGLNFDNLEFLVENIPPNIEKLKIGNSLLFHEEHIEILLHRCNKIKTLSVEVITDRSLKMIRQYLNLTLEELSLSLKFLWLTSFLQLKSMPRLTILNLNCRKEDAKKIQYLRQHLPHLKINVFEITSL